MAKRHRLALILATLAAMPFVGAVSVNAQQKPDPRVADIVRAGKLRVGMGLGATALALKDPATGELRGPAVDLAHALAARIGVSLESIEYPRPGAVMDGARINAWDVTFLAFNPARAGDVDFSTPYMQSDYTYVVGPGSSIRTAADVDQPGVRVAVPHGDTADLHSSRVLKRAEVVRVESFAAALELLRTGQAEASAGSRTNMLAESAKLPGARVLEDNTGFAYWAAVLPKGKAEQLAYVSEFIEEAKASGLVQQIITRNGLLGVQVAPPGNPKVQVE